MAMNFYASKISDAAHGTRCQQSVLQKSRGQRDRGRHTHTYAYRQHMPCHLCNLDSTEAGAKEPAQTADLNILTPSDDSLEQAIRQGNELGRRVEQLNEHDLKSELQQCWRIEQHSKTAKLRRGVCWHYLLPC
ncbi:uncharacterized protein LOC26528459 isoform X2 [Drosophila mojavensis]|uniref:uncharacterized protein LOC26528459 isoform X2 n=1 Tax=Drosophila mojavensis TaxID=7230 RepID=UPI001CD18B23|nr:uncharacterized protein LOC26528459 isoform X2 [Drosophila mojavensis]